MYKLGIDVGGTNTDAVKIDENYNVIASVKNPTTADIYDGIVGAVRKVLDESGVDKLQIGQAMLGTTQCTNAIVERKNLAKIGIIRIGAPASCGVEPITQVFSPGEFHRQKNLAGYSPWGCKKLDTTE